MQESAASLPFLIFAFCLLIFDLTPYRIAIVTLALLVAEPTVSFTGAAPSCTQRVRTW